jgi:DNA-binding NarL/FixJ family response regulator
VSDAGARDDVEVGGLLAAYAATAERWHELRSDARAANPVFDENARLAAELRASAAGRAGIARLMEHPASGVRVLAAAQSLPVFPEEAIAVLEALAAGSGLHAIAAEHALTEYRAGRFEP